MGVLFKKYVHMCNTRCTRCTTHTLLTLLVSVD